MTQLTCTAQQPELPEWLHGTINLADAALGAEAVAASDAFFAPVARMLQPEPAVFYPDLFDDHGKWMDGWETRRRRGTGYDWAVVALGVPGVVAAVGFDTRFFTGNYAPSVRLEGCFSPDSAPDATSTWLDLTGDVELTGDSHRLVTVARDEPVTHVRLNLHPDGGVARLRVYGQGWFDWSRVGRDERVELSGLAGGGREIACNDAHYGRPAYMLRPGTGRNMADGWETRRRRKPGHDWCILALGHPGVIDTVEVDTAHFKGNYPERVAIRGACVLAGTHQSLVAESQFWETLMPEQYLKADSVHRFRHELAHKELITHVRVDLIPDGGISRLRLWGWPRVPTSHD